MNPYPQHRCELAPLLVDPGIAAMEVAPHPTDPERLRHPPAVLPLDLSERLRMHRAVVGLLVNGYAPADGTDAGYVYAERLGIADRPGMPMHTGSAAWLVAVGESIGSRCQEATDEVHSRHGSTDEGNRGRGEGERPNSLRDRQGGGSGP